jgi:hypothetical protein
MNNESILWAETNRKTVELTRSQLIYKTMDDWNGEITLNESYLNWEVIWKWCLQTKKKNLDSFNKQLGSNNEIKNIIEQPSDIQFILEWVYNNKIKKIK